MVTVAQPPSASQCARYAFYLLARVSLRARKPPSVHGEGHFVDVDE
jgi:hypothetical protein